MEESNQYYLLGCGGHARSVADVILASSPAAEILFVDNGARPQEQIMGFPVVPEAPLDAKRFGPSIGNNLMRAEWCAGKELVSVISRHAHIGRDAKIGRGVFVGNAVHIGPQARIGEGTIVNTAAVVEHNVFVGRYCHIAPNSTICGGVEIGDYAMIGAGAVIKPLIKIASDVVVGAGAVVVSDIVEKGIYVGCPAKKLVKTGK